MEFDLEIDTHHKEEVKDITREIKAQLKQSDIESGLCNIYVTHATAAIIINENADPNIGVDFLKALRNSIPDHDNYLHDEIDNNAASHIKSALLGPSETIHVKRNSLVLGTWQSVMLVELDGPRRRHIKVKILSD